MSGGYLMNRAINKIHLEKTTISDNTRRSNVCAIFLMFLIMCSFAYAESGSLESMPPVPFFPENPLTPEKVELGKKLFFDRRLSGDGTMSCATCHNPETGFPLVTRLQKTGVIPLLLLTWLLIRSFSGTVARQHLRNRLSFP
jgi:hypothetical protein